MTTTETLLMLAPIWLATIWLLAVSALYNRSTTWFLRAVDSYRAGDLEEGRRCSALGDLWRDRADRFGPRRFAWGRRFLK